MHCVGGYSKEGVVLFPSEGGGGLVPYRKAVKKEVAGVGEAVSRVSGIVFLQTHDAQTLQSWSAFTGAAVNSGLV